MVEGTTAAIGATSPIRTDRTNFLLLPNQPPQTIEMVDAPRPADAPLVSCIMASRGQIFPAAHAIECFLRQTYPLRELVIATAAIDGALARHVDLLGDDRIRLIVLNAPESASRLRNAAIAASSGELIAVWDDDDLSHPDRIDAQYRTMRAAGAAACFLARVMLWWPERRRLAASSARIWENTMLVRREAMPEYPENELRGEDTIIAAGLRETQPLLLLDTPEAYCYVAHGGNLWNADHFDMLFGYGTHHFDGADYDIALRELAEDMPITAYERDRQA